MQYSELGLNRFGEKAEQSSQTESSVETSANPQDNVFSKHSNNGIDNGRSDARNVLTGTVITSCFIRTSDFPARIEMSGNDARFYDDSKGAGGNITGDTSSITFIRSDQRPSDFLIQKRHGINNDLDNVMEMFYSEPNPDGYNYFFLGRQGNGTNYNTNQIAITADHDTSKVGEPQNGQITLNLSRDGILDLDGKIAIYDADNYPGLGGAGTRVELTGHGIGGGIQMAWLDAGGVPTNYILIDKDGVNITAGAGAITLSPSITGGGYGGEVSAAGASVCLPSGWTCAAYGGADGYVVTHNLGNANYGVALTISEVNTNDATAYVYYKGPNHFNFNTREGGAFTTSYATMFTLIPS